jgi:hypothetical protein
LCDEEAMEEHVHEEKKNTNEAKHVEASLSFLLHYVVEVVHPCSPPVHKVKDATSINGELEESVEDVDASTPPAHEDKEMITFVDRLVRETLHMVDDHIDTFIETRIFRWDFGSLIFDRDPIYEIKGSPQENGFELPYL